MTHILWDEKHNTKINEVSWCVHCVGDPTNFETVFLLKIIILTWNYFHGSFKTCKYNIISRYNKKQKKNIKKRERKNPRKNQRKSNNDNKYFYVYSFLYGEKYISLENNLEKSFFKFRDIWNAVVKHQRCYRFALVL